MPLLYKILIDEKLARSRSEAERFIRQGSISVGGCTLDCSFFATGKCTCSGWRKVTKVTGEVEFGIAVKVGNGRWRVMSRLDGKPGYDLIAGIGRSRMDAGRAHSSNAQPSTPGLSSVAIPTTR